MLLIVMYQSQTWRVRPGEPFAFGRAPTRALEELALLLISTGELTAEDLRRLPVQIPTI